ncbi:MAG: NERD domain-containing protein [Gammaproteobacteria bacterium]|nr:NERD domain-containing protein [Gammaproteobacteria bacterium]
MMELTGINSSVLPALAGAILIVILISIWIIYRRRAGRSIDSRLRRVSYDLLKQFIIPDGDEGEIHVEYALLTGRGVIVLDIEHVEGIVFASDSMEDWTVMADRRRFTFANPQHGLFDRMAAVKRLLPDIPVTGFVVFTNKAKFSKGQPSNVIMFNRLIDELLTEIGDHHEEEMEAYQLQWDRLRDEAVAAQVGHLLRT